ncbi:MAG: hypothetical protein U0230_17855 [Polyangiales bacterium]
MSRNGTTLALIASALVLGTTGLAAAQSNEPAPAAANTYSNEPAADAEPEENDDTFATSDTTVEEDDRSFNEGRPIVEAHHYPLRYIDRPLNLHKKMIRLDGSLQVQGLPNTSDTGFGVALGGAVAFSNSFEVGLSSYRLNGYSWVTNNPGGAGLFPYRFQPSGQFGDIAIYGRYRIVNSSDFCFSFDMAVVIPTDSSSNWHMHVSAPIRARLAPRFNIDASFEIDLSFAEQSVSTVTGTTTEETKLYFYLPVAGVLQLHDQLWLAGRSGLFLPRGSFDDFFMPLTFDLGYTVAKRDRAPLLDIVATFGWPYLLTPGATTDTVNGNIWIAQLGLNGYFQL